MFFSKRLNFYLLINMRKSLFNFKLNILHFYLYLKINISTINLLTKTKKINKIKLDQINIKCKNIFY